MSKWGMKDRYRIIDGKRFHLINEELTKKEAEGAKYGYKRRGYLVRIIKRKESGKYDVWRWA